MFEHNRKIFNRKKEIAGIIAKYGWGKILSYAGFGESKLSFIKKSAEYQNIAAMLEELGPTFVKLGQFMSTRTDILPEHYIKDLERLQDKASTIDFSVIKEIMENELGIDISEVFSEISETPLAAASIGQVHSAVLLSGEKVVIKVQRPYIIERIDEDIEILYSSARQLENHFPQLKIYGLLDIIDDFSISIHEELKYTREARNTDKIREIALNESCIKIPKIYWDITTQKILVMEHMKGTKITEADWEHLNTSLIAENFAGFFTKQIFMEGIFHSDPHPGNILLEENGILNILDFGEVYRLDSKTRHLLIKMMISYYSEDPQGMAETLLDMGRQMEEVDMSILTSDIYKILKIYYDLPAEETKIGDIFMRVVQMCMRNKLILPASFTTLGKTLANVETISRKLDPYFNFTEVARPYIKAAAVKELLYTEHPMTEIYKILADIKSLLFKTPRNINKIFKNLASGTVKFELKHKELEDITDVIENASNKISMALIIAGCLVGSSFLINANQGHMHKSLFGMPFLGAVGYAIALIFGVWLVVKILKSGRKK